MGYAPRNNDAVGGDDAVKKSYLETLIKNITELNESGKSFSSYKLHKPVVIVSEASHHMISNLELLSDVRHNVFIANRQDISVRGIGKIELLYKNSEALYMPKLTSSLPSVQKETKDLECL